MSHHRTRTWYGEVGSGPLPSEEDRHHVQAVGDGLEGIAVVAVDEAQFFDDGLPAVCNELANRGYRVVVAGLDLDYEGRPFGPMPALLALAEEVTKLHAVCVETGRAAHFSHRIAGGTSQVELGAQDRYIPLARHAYVAANQETAQ